MDCASCAITVERALHQLHGVGDVQVDVVGGRVRVGYAGEVVPRAALAAAIRRVGYTVEEEQAPPPTFWTQHGRTLTAAISGAALVTGIGLRFAGAPRIVELVLLAVATVAGGWFVAPRGVRSLLGRSLDMNVLMSVAAAGAWIIGEPEEAAATLFLFAVAELLERYSMERARNAIGALVQLSPAEATVRRNGAEQRVAAASVAVGETVLVRPGEKIAVDGAVTSGRSTVNQAPITGESMPVDKSPGDDVFAGTLNAQGSLEVQATRLADDTTLARIIHAVEEAQASRAPSQRWVDRFARVYTPIVVLAAALLAVVPPLAGLGSWDTWIYRALAMLVIACPCALVISTPVSIVSGLAGAAARGVLIKGGVHLERLAAITAVALDKTGTLTEGRPALLEIVAFDGVPDDEILRLAMGVERHSEHPLAHAVLEAGRARGIGTPASTGFEALVGRGARARVGDADVFVGGERLLVERGLAAPGLDTALQRVEGQAMTAVVVGAERDGTAAVLGVLAIADRVRPAAATAVRALRDSGVRHVVMLTGDNAGTARAVAEAVGVDEFHAALLPDDKVRLVAELERRGERVAFVGDGVNDAPALAAAHVGVAMGAAGTDVAIETADVALMADDLGKLAMAVRTARRTMRIVRQNVTFALGLKAVFIVLAVAGWATLWMAVAADMGASLLVVGNGLRARQRSDPRD